MERRYPLRRRESHDFGRRWAGYGLALLAVGGAASSLIAQAYRPEIPRTWDNAAVATFELPLAAAEYSPVHVPAEYYYALPERKIWKSYPIYHPDFEPEGYREGLAELEPELIFDPAKLSTEQDWIDAGRDVFHAPISFGPPIISAGEVLDAAWYEAIAMPLADGGVLPYARWIIREKGRLEVGNLSCAMCHTRVMDDGSMIEGAQGNFPLDPIFARQLSGGMPEPLVRSTTLALIRAPWVVDDPLADMSLADITAAFAAIPPGVIVRQGTGLRAPAKVPDLIGIRDRKYLDATGFVVHRSIGDIMRYAAANQTMDVLARYGDYIPAAAEGELPPPGEGEFIGTADRYSDPQLFALARYLYSLQPPENPNPFDELARRGQEVFESQGCPQCHPPPLYTNNMLTPAPGFDPPASHYEQYEVHGRRVGTDPTLAMTTRRGTGYYKVPSLKGLWYRGPLEHSGSIATLEDWFDPARLEDDYVPTGFAGTEGPRPVPGHPFGLYLSDQDRQALIAFLRTL